MAELGGRAAETAATVLDVAVDAVRTAGGRHAEVACLVDEGERALTRFANSVIHQNVTTEVCDVRIVLAVDGRASTATAASTDPDVVRRTALAALAAARLRPPDPLWPGLSQPAAAPPAAGQAVRPTAAPEQRANAVAAFVDAAEGLPCAGFCATASTATGYANSAGVRLAGAVSAVTLDGIARAPGADGQPADGSGRQSGIDLAELDAAACGRQAAELARAAAEEPADVPPGTYPVVLRPGAVVDLLFWLRTGLSARPLAEGGSFARLGEEQFDRLVTLRCDADDGRLPLLPFDAEGTPRPGYDLVRDGVTQAVAVDRREARRAGTTSNGGAVRPGGFPDPMAAAVAMHPGTEAVDELVGGLERALLITDFWYTRRVEPRRLVVTGLTRNGVFLVEDGVATRPVRNLRFTQSYPEALGPGQVLGIGGDPGLFTDAATTADAPALLVPSLALAEWHITGTARG